MNEPAKPCPSQQWERFSATSHDQEDDLLLADLSTQPDDSKLAIAPLPPAIDSDQDPFDPLLARSGLGDAATPHQPARATDANPERKPLNETRLETEPGAHPAGHASKIEALIADYRALRHESSAAKSAADDLHYADQTPEIHPADRVPSDDNAPIFADDRQHDHYPARERPSGQILWASWLLGALLFAAQIALYWQMAELNAGIDKLAGQISRLHASVETLPANH